VNEGKFRHAGGYGSLHAWFGRRPTRRNRSAWRRTRHGLGRERLAFQARQFLFETCDLGLGLERLITRIIECLLFREGSGAFLAQLLEVFVGNLELVLGIVQLEFRNAKAL